MAAAKRPALPVILLANDLLDGDVVFAFVDGAGPLAWTRDPALALVAAAAPLAPRIRGLVRMGDRRWDIVLDRDQRILLPAEDPIRALERLLALDHAQEILARDLLAIDLRNDARPTLRLTPFAMNALRRTQGLDPMETEL